MPSVSRDHLCQTPHPLREAEYGDIWKCPDCRKRWIITGPGDGMLTPGRLYWKRRYLPRLKRKQ
jgi:hypothetical protein